MVRLAVAVVVLAALAAPASAKPHGHGPHGGNDRGGQEERDDRSVEAVGAVVITAMERALIRDYYRDNRAVLASDTLPPGMRKRLAQGKPLPPGIAKKLPDGLAARLQPRPGYEYHQVGLDVLLVEVATGVIVDMMRNVRR
ncbi:MAG: anti-virulence regulator CigR family protein [Solirubrobacterales bacterium]